MFLKCKMCGGELTLENEKTIAECEYCGTRQTVPSADSEKKTNLFNRANRLRMSAEFDKAAGVYESIVAEFPEEAEAYWGLCLCAYGIEYVDDPATGRKIPTCHRTRAESIMESNNFEMACEYADVIAKRMYRGEAREIDRLQREILAIVANESPYDVFICYKETAEDGGRSEDSVIAQDIYDALTSKGMKVFFARITLEDKLGQQYEPYIYAALHSAKVMLAIGTCFEHFDAVWVKNEWSRFLDMMKEDRTKVLVPCYKGVDAYDMPKEMRSLQAQDMGKLGFMQDLIRGVEKIVGKKELHPETSAAQMVVRESGVDADALLRRADMFLEDGAWASAAEYYDKVLDVKPECARAYMGKTLVKCMVKHPEALDASVMNDQDYIKALRFADDDLRAQYEAYQAGYHAKKEKLAQLRKKYAKLQGAFYPEGGVMPDGRIGGSPAHSQWRECVAITKNGIAGLKWDGTVISNLKPEKRKEIEAWQEITALAYAGRSVVGLKKDGTIQIVDEIERLKWDESIWKTWTGIKQIVGSDGHVLGLREDGTVVAMFGKITRKTDFSDWKDIVAVAAGEICAGLRADGTVIVEDESKWDVSQWRDIIALDAVGMKLAGLRADGTVVMTCYGKATTDGDRMKIEVEKWKNIISICVGSSIVGLQADGTLVSTDRELNARLKECCIFTDLEKLEEERSIAMQRLAEEDQAESVRIPEMCKRLQQGSGLVSLTAECVVAVKSDGTVYASGRAYHDHLNVKHWKQIVSVATSGSHTVGIKDDGRAVAIGTNDESQCNVSSWRDIVMVTVEGHFSLGLRKDGTIATAGSFKGMYDVSRWNDIIYIASDSDVVVGLKKDGTLVAAGDEKKVKELEGMKNVCFIGLKKYHDSYIVVRADGSIEKRCWDSRESVEIVGACDEWKEIVSLDIMQEGQLYVFGVKEDGKLLCETFSTKSRSLNSVSLRDVEWFDNLVGVYAKNGFALGLKRNGTLVTIADRNDGIHRNANISFGHWRLFDRFDTRHEEYQKKEQERHEKISKLREERKTVVSELDNLRGLFTGKRRKELEEKLWRIEMDLKELD